MKPSDYNAWLDGTATPRQQRGVERELGPAASIERKRWARLRGLLREHLAAPPLDHPDFISARVAEAIRRAPAPAPSPEG